MDTDSWLASEQKQVTAGGDIDLSFIVNDYARKWGDNVLWYIFQIKVVVRPLKYTTTKKKKKTEGEM